MLRPRQLSIQVGGDAAASGALPRSEPVSLAGPSDMLDKEDSLSQITAWDKWGFTVNGIHMRGSVLVLPRYTLLWNVTRVVDIAPRNLAPLHMLKPRIGAWWRWNVLQTSPHTSPQPTLSLPLL